MIPSEIEIIPFSSSINSFEKFAVTTNSEAIEILKLKVSVISNPLINNESRTYPSLGITLKVIFVSTSIL